MFLEVYRYETHWMQLSTCCRTTLMLSSSSLSMGMK
jgi:hypothetical protein